MVKKLAAREGTRNIHWEQLIFFLAAVLLGSLLIVLGALREWHPLVQMGVAIGIMLVYIAGSYHRSPAVIKWGNFADSIYYLGFIFTLVALLAMLLVLGFIVEDETDNKTLLGQFGVALTTTVVGLVARIALVSFVRVDGEEAFEAAGASFVREVQTFQRQLEQVRVELEGQAGVIQGTLAQASKRVEAQIVVSATRLEESTANLVDASTNTADALKKNADLSTQHWERIGASLAGRADELLQASVAEAANKILHDANKSVADALSGLRGAVNGLSIKLEAFETGTQFLVDGVEPAVEKMKSSLTSLSDQMDQSTSEFGEGFRSATNQLGSLGGTLDKYDFDNLLSGVSPGLAALADTVADLEARAGELGQNVSEASVAAKGLASTLGEAVVFIIRELSPNRR